MGSVLSPQALRLLRPFVPSDRDGLWRLSASRPALVAALLGAGEPKAAASLSELFLTNQAPGARAAVERAIALQRLARVSSADAPLALAQGMGQRAELTACATFLESSWPCLEPLPDAARRAAARDVLLDAAEWTHSTGEACWSLGAARDVVKTHADVRVHLVETAALLRHGAQMAPTERTDLSRERSVSQALALWVARATRAPSLEVEGWRHLVGRFGKGHPLKPLLVDAERRLTRVGGERDRTLERLQRVADARLQMLFSTR